MANKRVTFRFNPDTQTPGPFDVRFVYQEEGQSERIWSGQKASLNRELSFNFHKSEPRWGTGSLYLDESLAFQGLLLFEEIPF